MANFIQNQPLESFDWDAYEKGVSQFSQTNKSKVYDSVSELKQGIAIVTKNGKFGAIMVGGKEIVPPIYDDLSEFKDGYAVTKWNNEERVVNLSGQIRVLKGNKEIFLPEEYDWGFDFIEGICVVVKNGKFGIVNTKFELIIPCEYEHIEALSEDLFKFREGGKWGIINKSRELIAGAEYLKISYETENLLRIETPVQNGSSIESRYGLLDTLGNIIVPSHCKNITKVEHENNVFIIPEINGKQGVYDKDGKLIIPFIYSSISVHDDYFYCWIYHNSAIYHFNGDHLLYLNDNKFVIIPSEYDYAEYAGCGLIKVSKAGKWGLINLSGQSIIEPGFTCIDKFDGAFARVGKSLIEQNHTYFGSYRNNKDFLYGLVDTSGEVVLPIEYEEIEKWYNAYYVVRKDGLHGLLSPTLHMIIEPCRVCFNKLDDNYIFIKVQSESSVSYLQGLIDYYGNEIIPAYENISEVEVFENGFLKVIYHRSVCEGCSHIGILNAKGKKVYYNNECDDITDIGDGLLMVKSSYAGKNTYNIANLQGKELFEYSLNEIRLLEDGNFSVRGNKGWGFSDRMGNLIVPPRYENELKFENGFADISIAGKGETLKINSNGNIQIENDKEPILLPNIYYWGSNFKHGVSIVRSKARDYIGIVNIHGEEIIPTIYKSIKLLSDRTILCREDDCYGLYNTKGKCILPVIFSKINHVAKNRIRVVWNLNIAKSWEKDKYEKGNSVYKFQGSGTEYEVNQRAALCDSCGIILNDKQNLYVSEFTGKYAKVYNEIKVENYKTLLSQVGVIDLDCNTLVPPEYDRIFLYEHSFAKLRKGKIFGIANLPSKKITMFESLQINRMWDLDEYGRCLYSTDWAYDKEDEEWKGTKGVLSFDGVIVPPEKYDKIILLENGLIKVYKDNAIGLLDKRGKELLPLKYSYLSDFVGKYATICLGGTKSKNFPYNIIGGKWGMIDDEGNIVNKCENNEEQVIPSVDNKPIVAEDTTDYRKPTVLLSDYIPEEKISYSDNYYYDNSDDDYDNGYIKYGGYNGYDDDTIDSAFEGDPELTWNID